MTLVLPVFQGIQYISIIYTKDGIVCLIMDFCDAGELAKQIRRTRRKHEKLPEKLVLRWFTWLGASQE